MRIICGNMLKVTIGILVLMVASASAGEFHLTNSNVAEAAGIDVKVTTDGANKLIDVQLVNNPLANTPLGIDNFFYQLDGGKEGLYKIQSVTESDWVTNFNGLEADGFGEFLSHKSHNPAGTGGISGPIGFTLDNAFTDDLISSNDNGAKFAVHIRYSDSCSVWVSDGISNDQSSISNCVPQRHVPEFPSIALPIAAVIGLVLFFQYNKRKN